MGARRRPSIMVVPFVDGGPSWPFVGTCQSSWWWVLVANRQRSWEAITVVRRWWCWAPVDVGGRSSPFLDRGGGGGEKRAVVTCDIAFVTSPNWDVSNRVQMCRYFLYLQHCVAVLLLGSVPLLVYPRLQGMSKRHRA